MALNEIVLRRVWLVLLAVVALFGIVACDNTLAPWQPIESLRADAVFHPEFDADLWVCRTRANAATAEPDLGGTPAYDANRADVLGRAPGEPMVFVREPKRLASELMTDAQRAIASSFDRSPPGVRVARLIKQHSNNPGVLRTILLPEGYVYASDPYDAAAVVRSLELKHAFDDPVLWLQRRDEVFRLERGKLRKTVVYRYADGARKGQEAQLLFGDRVAAHPGDLANPLHRDLRTLARDVGFDRTQIEHRAASALVTKVRFGDRWVRGVMVSEGARLRLACLVEPRETVAHVEAWIRDNSHRIRARREMEKVIDDMVDEGLRFDRPIDAEDHFQDGVLRPLWRDAYRRGQTGFGHDGRSYPVYMADGRPSPPQVCVDLVLDTYERTSGTWFRPRGEAPERVVGRLDFNELGIKNRRGVIAFGDFAESNPSLFTFRRFEPAERIPFGRRKEYFANLVKLADSFGPAHVVAIQGRKRDGYIHQHAIFIETVDPVTGFPHGLFDQMKRPRRRTWEGIMAEAPARSLYYVARPTDRILRAMDPEQAKPMPSPFRRVSLP